MSRRARRILVASAAVLAVLAALYAAAGFLLAPWLVARELPGQAAHLGYRASVGKVAVNPFLLSAEARDLTLATADGRPIAHAARLAADLAWASLLHRTWIVDALSLSGATIHVERAADGSVNLAPRRPAAAPPARAADPGPPPLVVKRLAAEAERIDYADLGAGADARVALTAVKLEADDLTTLAGAPGRYRLRASLPRGGRIAASGELALAKQSGELRVDGLSAATLWPFVGRKLRLAPPEGVIGASTVFRVEPRGRGSNVVLDKLELAVAGLVLRRPGAEAPLLRLKRAAAHGGRLDLGARELEFAAVDAADGQAAVERAADGTLNWSGLAAAEEEAPAAAPWHVVVRAVEAGGIGITAVDHSFDPALSYGATAAVKLRGIDRKASAPIAAEATVELAEGGRLALRGELAQDASRADGKAELADFALPALQPLVARFARATLAAGRLGGSATLRYAREAEPRLALDGNLQLDDLRVTEAPGGGRLLAAKALSARGKMELAPTRVAIDRIDIRHPEAKLTISADHQFNLAQTLKHPAGGGEKAAEAAAPAAQIHIARIDVRDGVVDYADDSLVLPFSTRVENFQGSALGIDSRPGAEAVLEAKGTIRPYGSARVAGRLAPRAPTEFTDIRVNFDNVEMPPLSPYTATFAGRKVSSGKLWLDLQYKIDHGRMVGQNGVALQDFTLGERVDAPRAMDLPLDLAVALLKDEHGRIDLAVPVEGDVKNPHFDYGAVVRAAIGRTLSRIVTAPFRALGRLLGGGQEADLGEIAFAPGSAEVTPPQREKLDHVAAALAQRPQLKLLVGGAYDPKRDGPALAAEAIRRELAQRLGRRLAPGEAAGPVDFADPRTQAALDALAAGAPATAPPGAEPQGRHGNPATYRALFERLVAARQPPEAELQRLAKARAAAVADYLAHAKLGPDRVQAGELRAVQGSGDTIATRLDVDARAHAS